MTDQPNPPSPLPAGFPPLILEKDKNAGCLKWGLIGCAGLSVILIVGLVVLTMRAKSVIGWALDKLEQQVTAVATPEVSPGQKEEFQRAMRHFVEKAKDGKVSPGNIQRFQGEVMQSIQDGRVTSPEMDQLTRTLKEVSR